MLEKPKTTGHPSADGARPSPPVSTLFLQGFGQQQIARLVQTRSKFLKGDLSEWATWATENDKPLRFARWLVENGRLNEQ